MPASLGAAQYVTCPACGMGEAARLCSLTRGTVESLICDACSLFVRNGLVVARGVALDPDVVVELGRTRAPQASVDQLYCDPHRRPVRLVASWAGRPADEAAALRGMTSITLRFARPRGQQ